jgi:hypothetical protein
MVTDLAWEGDWMGKSGEADCYDSLAYGFRGGWKKGNSDSQKKRPLHLHITWRGVELSGRTHRLSPSILRQEKSTMKKLLVLTSVLMLAAATVGCESCGGLFRGSRLFGPEPSAVYAYPSADACNPCGNVCDPCGTAAPATIMPGPETYVPAPVQ